MLYGRRRRSRNFIMGTAIKTRLLSSQSDEKLLELARDRSQSAWQTLSRRYQGLLLRYCRQLCLSEEMAQEVARTALSDARRGIEAGAKPPQMRPWLHEIAHRIAVQELGDAGLPAQGDAVASGAPLLQSRAIVDGAPTPDELLALRGALSAMSSDRGREEGIVVHRSNGSKVKVAEDAFAFTDSAVRGLLGRARRGISALTPPPLLAWAMGRAAEGGAPSERMVELGTSGGAASLAGLALKGGLAAITAGVAIGGAVIAHSSGGLAPHPRSHGVSPQASVEGASAPAQALGDVGAVVQHDSGTRLAAHADGSRAVALEPGQASSPSAETSHPSVTPTSAESPSMASPSSEQSAATDPPSSTTGTAGASVSTASASAPASAQSPPTQSGGETAGHGTGIGVQVSAGSGSGQQAPGGSGGGGSAQSTSSSSEASKGIGIGISVSLEPLGSVGVHVSLP